MDFGGRRFSADGFTERRIRVGLPSPPLSTFLPRRNGSSSLRSFTSISALLFYSFCRSIFIISNWLIDLAFPQSTSEGAWDVQNLLEAWKPDHGFTLESKAIRNLAEILSTYTKEEQRLFLQFVSGSPRLPVGGINQLLNGFQFNNHFSRLVPIQVQNRMLILNQLSPFTINKFLRIAKINNDNSLIFRFQKLVSSSNSGAKDDGSQPESRRFLTFCDDVC